MSNEKLKDSLSAMMDAAADELEVCRVLANADENIMAVWSRYQIVHSVMRKEVIFPELNIAFAVSEAISKEDDAAQQKTSLVAKQKVGLWRYMAKFAVAASVLGIAISTVYFLNGEDLAESTGGIYAQTELSVDNLSHLASNELQLDQIVAELVDTQEGKTFLTIEQKDLDRNTQVE